MEVTDRPQKIEPARKFISFSREEVTEAMVRYAKEHGEIIPDGTCILNIDVNDGSDGYKKRWELELTITDKAETD